MAIGVGAGYGLTKGGRVYSKELVNNTWVPREIAKDASGPGKPPAVTINGGPNKTTYIQVDNNGVPGDEDVFWRVLQDARGNVVSATKQAPLIVDRNQGMKTGATIQVLSADGKRLLYTAKDQSGADLDQKNDNVKFSTLTDKGSTFRVRIANPDGQTLDWMYRNIGAANATRTKIVPPPPAGKPSQAWINNVKTWGDNVSWYVNKFKGNDAALRNDYAVNEKNGVAGVATDSMQKLLAARNAKVQLSNGQMVDFDTAAKAAGASSNWATNGAAFMKLYQTSKYVNPNIDISKIENAFSQFKTHITDIAYDLLPDFPENLGVAAVSKWNGAALKNAADKTSLIASDYKILMDQVKTYSGTPEQLNFQMRKKFGDIGTDWYKYTEDRLTTYAGKVADAAKTYSDGIAKASKIEDAEIAQNNAFAWVSLVAGSINFLGSGALALNSLSKYRGTDRSLHDLVGADGSAVNSISGAMGAADAAAYISLNKKDPTKFAEAKEAVRLNVDTDRASHGIKTAFQTITDSFRKAEAQIAKLYEPFQVREQHVADYPRRDRGPGWDAVTGMYPPDDWAPAGNFLGYREFGYRYGEEQSVDRVWYKRWLTF